MPELLAYIVHWNEMKYYLQHTVNNIINIKYLIYNKDIFKYVQRESIKIIGQKIVYI